MAYIASFEKKIYEKAKRESFKKGFKIGFEKSRTEIVKNMLKEKLNLELIARCCGLSVEEVKKIEKA